MNKQINICKKVYSSIVDMMYTKFLDKNWVDIHKYGTRADIENGEVGMLDGIRYFVKYSNGEIVK